MLIGRFVVVIIVCRWNRHHTARLMIGLEVRIEMLIAAVVVVDLVFAM